MPPVHSTFQPPCVVLPMNLNLVPKQLPSIILAATANSSPASHFFSLKKAFFLLAAMELPCTCLGGKWFLSRLVDLPLSTGGRQYTCMHVCCCVYGLCVCGGMCRSFLMAYTSQFPTEESFRAESPPRKKAQINRLVQVNKIRLFYLALISIAFMQHNHS